MKKIKKILMCALLISCMGNCANCSEPSAPVPTPTLTKLQETGAVAPDSIKSIYAITEGSDLNHAFTIQGYDSSGQAITQYYKIKLNMDDLNSDIATWKEIQLCIKCPCIMVQFLMEQMHQMSI